MPLQDPWALYDALIAGVGEGPVVADAVVNRWAAVRTDSGAVGLAMAFDGGPRAPAEAWRVRGRPLREVAAYAKSWDLRLASLGVAALNAWYAQPERLNRIPGIQWGPDTSFFPRVASGPEGRRTVVVGHFRGIEDLGEVTVLERDPRGADLPDSACEYVLPAAELVAITGSALVNKTLPRLLALARGAQVHLVGPTATPAPGVYPACVAGVAGSAVVDPEPLWRSVCVGVRGAAGSGALAHFRLNPRCW